MQFVPYSWSVFCPPWALCKNTVARHEANLGRRARQMIAWAGYRRSGGDGAGVGPKHRALTAPAAKATLQPAGIRRQVEDLPARGGRHQWPCSFGPESGRLAWACQPDDRRVTRTDRCRTATTDHRPDRPLHGEALQHAPQRHRSGHKSVAPGLRRSTFSGTAPT